MSPQAVLAAAVLQWSVQKSSGQRTARPSVALSLSPVLPQPAVACLPNVDSQFVLPLANSALVCQASLGQGWLADFLWQRFLFRQPQTWDESTQSESCAG